MPGGQRLPADPAAIGSFVPSTFDPAEVFPAGTPERRVIKEPDVARRGRNIRRRHTNYTDLMSRYQERPAIPPSPQGDGPRAEILWIESDRVGLTWIDLEAPGGDHETDPAAVAPLKPLMVRCGLNALVVFHGDLAVAPLKLGQGFAGVQGLALFHGRGINPSCYAGRSARPVPQLII